MCGCSPEPGLTQPAAAHALSKERKTQNRSLHCVSHVSGDAVIPISEHFILLVELPFVFANGHRKPFLFKIRLLFFSNGCFF